MTLRPAAGWPGHRAGQFVLVDFGHRLEGAHRYRCIRVVGSAGDGRAGDQGTRRLHAACRSVCRWARRQRWKAVWRFRFSAREGAGPQVWVAGGIGVTPFLARLRVNWEQGRRAEDVALFYSVRNNDVDAFGGELADLCRATGVQLQRWESDAQGPLPRNAGRQAGRAWQQRVVLWPLGLGESLRLWLSGAGLPGGGVPSRIFRVPLNRSRGSDE